MMISMSTHQLIWLFFALDLGLLAWAGWDFAMGQTCVEQPWRLGWEKVRQDQEPQRFRWLIICNVVGAVTCMAIAVVLLICGG